MNISDVILNIRATLNSGGGTNTTQNVNNGAAHQQQSLSPRQGTVPNATAPNNPLTQSGNAQVGNNGAVNNQTGNLTQDSVPSVIPRQILAPRQGTVSQSLNIQPQQNNDPQQQILAPRQGTVSQSSVNTAQLVSDNVSLTTSNNIQPQPDTGNGVHQQPLPPRQGVTTQKPDNEQSAGFNTIPSYNDLDQYIRKELSQRGAVLVPGTSNFTQLMNSIKQQAQNKADIAINNDNIQKATDTETAYSQQVTVQTENLEKERAEKLQKAQQFGSSQADIDRINARYDERIQDVKDRLFVERSQAWDKENQDADKERKRVEEDLTKIAAEIVQQLKNGQTLKPSYLGGLRQEYQEAITRRNNAETEEDAIKASREAAAIQAQIQRGMGGGGNILTKIRGGWGTFASLAGIGVNAYRSYMDNERAKTGELGQAASGDFIGAMQSDLQRRRNNASAWGETIGGALGAVAGGALGAAGTLGVGVGAGAAGGAALGMGAGNWIGSAVFDTFYGGKEEENQLALAGLWANQEKRIQAYSDLALMRSRATGNGLEGERNQLINDMPTIQSSGGLTVHDLGYTAPEFAQQVRSRLLRRGFTENASGYDAMWYAMNSDALEKVYNMSSGSLAQLSSYDRYTTNGRRNNANQDVANLVASLNNMRTLGMSGGQTYRTDEFVGYQQQLMEMQKAYMNPNSEYAQRQLLAAQAMFGDNMDNRAISEWGQIENAVTHPQEGYSKAILYDTIQSIMPETRGSLLKIRQAQYSDDPRIRQRIQQAMFKRLTQIYGGTDTTSGYMALSQYTGIEDPDRLRKWVNGMQKELPKVSHGSVSEDTSRLQEYTPAASKKMLEYQDQVMIEINNNLDSMVDLSQQMLSTFNTKLGEIVQGIKSQAR